MNSYVSAITPWRGGFDRSLVEDGVGLVNEISKIKYQIHISKIKYSFPPLSNPPPGYAVPLQGGESLTLLRYMKYQK
jgi:hypothetical protein